MWTQLRKGICAASAQRAGSSANRRSSASVISIWALRLCSSRGSRGRNGRRQRLLDLLSAVLDCHAASPVGHMQQAGADRVLQFGNARPRLDHRFRSNLVHRAIAMYIVPAKVVRYGSVHPVAGKHRMAAAQIERGTHGRTGRALAGKKAAGQRGKAAHFVHAHTPYDPIIRRPKPPDGRTAPLAAEAEPGTENTVRRKFFSSRSAI